MLEAPMKLALGMAVVAVALTPSCGEEPAQCNTMAAAGVAVTVTDSMSSDPICDATVTASSGAYEESLGPAGTACSYVGLWERPGTFAIEVAKTGYKSATRSVTVPQGECHVAQQNVAIALSPL